MSNPQNDDAHSASERKDNKQKSNNNQKRLGILASVSLGLAILFGGVLVGERVPRPGFQPPGQQITYVIDDEQDKPSIIVIDQSRSGHEARRISESDFERVLSKAKEAKESAENAANRVIDFVQQIKLLTPEQKAEIKRIVGKAWDIGTDTAYKGAAKELFKFLLSILKPTPTPSPSPTVSAR